jgi:DNA-binding transcriptional MocR family regulator
MFTPMNFPPQLQQKIEKWASSQGISTEQFVLQAIAEKIDALSQQMAEEHTEQNSEVTNVVSSNQPKVYRKEGILVVDAELPENFDLNTFIDELREERIRNQMAVMRVLFDTSY